MITGIPFNLRIGMVRLQKFFHVKPNKYCHIWYSGWDQAFIQPKQKREPDLILRQAIIRDRSLFLISGVLKRYIFSYFKESSHLLTLPVYLEKKKIGNVQPTGIHHWLRDTSDWEKHFYYSEQQNTNCFLLVLSMLISMLVPLRRIAGLKQEHFCILLLNPLLILFCGAWSIPSRTHQTLLTKQTSPISVWWILPVHEEKHVNIINTLKIAI